MYAVYLLVAAIACIAFAREAHTPNTIHKKLHHSKSTKIPRYNSMKSIPQNQSKIAGLYNSAKVQTI